MAEYCHLIHQSNIYVTIGILKQFRQLRLTSANSRNYCVYQLAIKLLRRAAENLADGAKLERAPMMEARSLSIILAPDEVAVAANSGANGSTESTK